MKFDWQKSFVDGQMNNYVFDIAGAMCEYGVWCVVFFWMSRGHGMFVP